MITKNDELPLEWEHFKHVDYGIKIPDAVSRQPQ